jgi:hypothetical protein
MSWINLTTALGAGECLVIKNDKFMNKKTNNMSEESLAECHGKMAGVFVQGVKKVVDGFRAIA